MKKFLIILSLLTCFLFLTACSTNTPAAIKTKNSLIPGQMTEREKAFLSLGTTTHFVFDYTIDDTYKWVEVWVDRYEFGRLSDSTGKLATSLGEYGEGMILARVSLVEETELWEISVTNGTSNSTSRSNRPYDEGNFVSTWQTNTAPDIPITGEEIVLANLTRIKDTNTEQTLKTVTDTFYLNPNENLHEIEDYDEVFVFKCKFFQDKPSN